MRCPDFVHEVSWEIMRCNRWRLRGCKHGSDHNCSVPDQQKKNMKEYLHTAHVYTVYTYIYYMYTCMHYESQIKP